jgi:preprotein translocase subunit SecF
MSNERVINFMGQRKLAAALSIILLVASVVSLALQGLNLAQDFTGGTSVELVYDKPADLGEIRSLLAGIGYDGAVIQYFGAETDVKVSLQEAKTDGLAEQLTEALRLDGKHEVDVASVSFIGPQVGDDLRDQGGLGMIVALVLVMLYVSMRFQFKFALGAVAALIHDVVIVVGFFSIFQWDFDLTVLAAILAVVGYSINDTIVIFDRIRENFRIMRKSSATEVINTAITQTLSRTMVTSGTTVLVLVALYYFGGALIHSFATALLLGIIVGTFSSVYISSTILVAMHVTKEDLMPPEKEGDELDAMP